MISLKKIETQKVIFVKKLPIFMFINRFHFIVMQYAYCLNPLAIGFMQT